MLSLMLTLLADPTATPVEEQVPSVLAELDIRAADLSRLGTPECGNARLQRADEGDRSPESLPVTTTDLMYRSGDVVRRDLLLDRRIDGCAAPISVQLRMPAETQRLR